MSELAVRKGRIFDTDEELLRLLGFGIGIEDTDPKSSTKTKTVTVSLNKKTPEDKQSKGSSGKPKIASVSLKKTTSEKHKQNGSLGKPKTATVSSKETPEKYKQNGSSGRPKTAAVSLNKTTAEKYKQNGSLGKPKTVAVSLDKTTAEKYKQNGYLGKPKTVAVSLDKTIWEKYKQNCSLGKHKTATVSSDKTPETYKENGSSGKPTTVAVSPDKTISEKCKQNSSLAKPKSATVSCNETPEDGSLDKPKTVAVSPNRTISDKHKENGSLGKPNRIPAKYKHHCLLEKCKSGAVFVNKTPEKHKQDDPLAKPKTATVSTNNKTPENHRQNDPVGKPGTGAVSPGKRVPERDKQDALFDKLKTAVVALHKLPEKDKTQKTRKLSTKRGSTRKRKKLDEEPSPVKPKSGLHKEPPKKRGRPRKFRTAETQTYVEPTMETVQELPIAEPQPCGVTMETVQEQPVTKEELCRILTQLYPPGTIKPKIAKVSTDEIVDLTCEETEAANLTDMQVPKATLTVEPEYLHTALRNQPIVQYHCPDSIDLTQTEPLRTAISEKGCASRLVSMILSCHHIVIAGQMLEKGMHELEKGLPFDNYLVTYDHVFWLIWDHASSCSSKLWEAMDGVYVRNLNIERFLDILTCKLSTEYKVELSHFCVANYLHMLLNRNRDRCEGFAGTMLKGLEEYFQETRLKVEGGVEEGRPLLEEPFQLEQLPVAEKFTPQQLTQLHAQICQYLELSERQEALMAGFPDATTLKAEWISVGLDCFTEETRLDGAVIVVDD